MDLKKLAEIALDDFSLINVEFMAMLLEALPACCNVTVFGDPYQLEPVDGEAIEPEMYTDDIYELTKQHRAEAPEVVETFMRFVAYISGTGEMDLTMNPKIKEGTVRDFNPETDKCIAYTNAKVLELNNAVGKVLGLPKTISIGEEIAINGVIGTLVDEPQSLETIRTIYPKCISKGKLMTGQKLIETIESVEDDMEKFNTNISKYKVGYINIGEDIYRFHYDLDHYANAKGLKAYVEEAQFDLIESYNLAKDVDLKKWCAEHRSDPKAKKRGKAWSEYLAHQGLVWDKRRPFASTVHKTQGQEFHTVYIAQDDLKKAIRKGYYLKYARLMYVALSRAIKKVVLV